MSGYNLQHNEQCKIVLIGKHGILQPCSVHWLWIQQHAVVVVVVTVAVVVIGVESQKMLHYVPNSSAVRVVLHQNPLIRTACN